MLLPVMAEMSAFENSMLAASAGENAITSAPRMSQADRLDCELFISPFLEHRDSYGSTELGTNMILFAHLKRPLYGSRRKVSSWLYQCLCL